MPKRKLKYSGRHKAFLGSETGAILAAAGINAATQMAAAGINSMATKQAAKDQAQATIQSAQRHAQAIKDQTARSGEYQQESQEFIKEQNAENRELQKDIQLQLRVLTGQQNVNDRLEASKIKVRNGGSTRRRLRTAGNDTFFLRGSDNLPFTVTDGGGVIALGTTPEGYDIYELYGNDHDHYHKAQGGKNKTGVGIKFADGNIIEGEGNQNTNQGELMVNTPGNAYFLSKHSIAGFNPARMTLAGMHPLQAYIIQEQLKAANGISDDGKTSSPVKKIAGGMLPNPYTMNNQSGPQMGVDTVGDTAAGVAYVYNTDTKRRLRCGGKVRHKAENGFKVGNRYWDWNTGNLVTATDERGYSGPVPYDKQPVVPAGTVVQTSPSPVPTGTVSPTTTTTPTKQNFWSRAGSWIDKNPDLAGAGITGLGNIGGALITSIGNRSAARTLAGAYNKAASIMSDAYSSLRTIDMDSIRREDFAAAHALPAIQAPVSMAASHIADVDRQLQRRLSNAGRYSSSGAASIDRMTRAEVDAQDMRNKIYSADQEQMQNIRQGNAERTTYTAIKNAELDTIGNQQYANAYLNLLQYKNDIENEKILGAAGALSEGAVNRATALAQAHTGNASAWSQALVGSAQGFANSFSNMATRKADLEKVKLGAVGDTQAIYYANSGLATDAEARAFYDALERQYKAAKDNDTKNILRRRANIIASARGYKLI